jgi:hypothetical protein
MLVGNVSWDTPKPAGKESVFRLPMWSPPSLKLMNRRICNETTKKDGTEPEPVLASRETAMITGEWIGILASFSTGGYRRPDPRSLPVENSSTQMPPWCTSMSRHSPHLLLSVPMPWPIPTGSKWHRCLISSAWHAIFATDLFSQITSEGPTGASLFNIFFPNTVRLAIRKLCPALPLRAIE